MRSYLRRAATFAECYSFVIRRTGRWFDTAWQRHHAGSAKVADLDAKTRFAEGWRTRQTFKIFSQRGLCSAKGTRRRRTSKNHFRQTALFTFSLSLVCM